MDKIKIDLKEDCSTCLYEKDSGPEHCGSCDLVSNYKQDPFFAECLGCKELEAELETHRWIPVSERLPEQWERSNYRSDGVWVTDGNVIWQTALHIKRQRFLAERFNCSKDITHWKPIILPK